MNKNKFLFQLKVMKVWQAFKVYRAAKRFKRARMNSLRVSRGERARYPWYEECWTWMMECCPTNRLLRRLCSSGTIENFTLKSCFGFGVGVLSATAMFFFFLNQLNCNPRITSILSCLIGALFANGLAFSHECRCMTMLAVPQLFSSRGRVVLLAYTYILVMSGPTKNALRNANILVSSLNCGQELVVKQTKAILKAIFAPLVVIVDAMRDILKALKSFAIQVKEAFIAIRDLFLEIIEAIKTIFEWLMRIVSVCSSRYGSPYNRCLRAFDDAKEDCMGKMGAFSFLCNIVSSVQFVCEVARIVDLLCSLPKAIKTGIIEPLKEHLQVFTRYMYYQFYVNVTFVHYYNYSLEQSKSFSEIRGDIAQEIKHRTEWITAFIDWSDLGLAFVFFILIFKAYVYRLRYKKADHFDNKYISSDFVSMDDRRAIMGKETVLPLTKRERRKYVSTFSVRMVAAEKKKLSVSGMALLTSGIQMALYIILDYSLYHLLIIIRFYGKIQSKGRLPSGIQLEVKGSGVLADMYRQIITQFDPLMSTVPEFDTTECLPDPIPIDLDKYQKIGFLYILCVLMVFTESYGLRLRHIICSLFYPEREKLRTVWLYNKILRSRGGIRKYLRRKLRRKFYGDDTTEQVSLVWRLINRYTLLWKLLKFFGFVKQYCLVCNEVADDSFRRCMIPGCKGLYCLSCFEELDGLCTLCMNPVCYGDFSDLSEERLDI
nr:DC-STAMP domain-containing protein 2 [Parasteatoda tepidariorum]